MATSSTSPATFTGSSAFSAQLAQVISNAVAQASAPMNTLQAEQATLQGQQTELQTLTTDFQNLQNALDSLNSAAGSGSYSASVSNQSVATASVGSGVMAGTYSIDVTNTGSQTMTMSANGLTKVTDPTSANIDSSSAYTLTVNGQTYQVTDSGGTLEGLASAINTSGADVQATVVNVGSSSSPDYRLAVQSLDYAPDTIQLSDGTNNSLLTSLSTGSNVTYQVNGETSTVSSSSRSLTLAPGLTVNLTGVGSTTITVGQNTSAISSALSSFASAYNSVSAELTKNRGQNGGALAGQSLVYELQSALQNIATYSSASGNITSVADLGLTFDQNGNLDFDASTFAQLSPSDVANFLGSENSNGFLASAETTLASVNDPTTGMLPEQTQQLTSELSNISTQIGNDQNQITQLQDNLTTQMSQADAAISSLEQQTSELTTLFNDMQNYSYNASH